MTGAAADAILEAESLLARQRSDAAHLDLQVLTAIVNAHATAGAGLARLEQLQRDIETAVASRTDLDTPAGARELQRFLIGKVRDIRDVVEQAGLDASSKAALAEALVALYASSTPDALGGENSRPPTPQRSDDETLTTDDGPLTWSLLDEAPVPDYLSAEVPVADPDPLAAPAMPPAPAMAMPPFSGGAVPATPLGGMPFGGGLPSNIGGGAPGVFSQPLPDFSPAGQRAPDLDDLDLPGPDSDSASDRADDPVTGTTEDERASAAETPAEPTPILLPDGQTVIAPSPELASVITAAVSGAPIPTAFGWQGITIPAPGSPVVAPVDPARLVPGDIAVLADRHALALGNGQVLLDQQIQPMSSVTGPGFIGWQHPPKPDPMNTPPVLPAPDRSAATAPS